MCYHLIVLEVRTNLTSLLHLSDLEAPSRGTAVSVKFASDEERSRKDEFWQISAGSGQCCRN